jgi:hypothetical protein
LHPQPPASVPRLLLCPLLPFRRAVALPRSSAALMVVRPRRRWGGLSERPRLLLPCCLLPPVLQHSVLEEALIHLRVRVEITGSIIIRTG